MKAPVLAVLAATTTASYDDNINFKSPSFEYPSKDIDMPKMTRRHLQKRDYNVTIDSSKLNFTHVRPIPDSVILRARISPRLENDRSNVTIAVTVPLYSHETERYNRASTSGICVDYQVSTNKNISGGVVGHGRAYTTSDIDYTVKVEAKGLSQLSLTTNALKFADLPKQVQLAAPRHRPAKTMILQSWVLQSSPEELPDGKAV